MSFDNGKAFGEASLEGARLPHYWLFLLYLLASSAVAGDARGRPNCEFARDRISHRLLADVLDKWNGLIINFFKRGNDDEPE